MVLMLLKKINQKRLLNNTKDSFANIWAYFPKEYYLGVVSQSKNDNDRAKVFFKSSLKIQSLIFLGRYFSTHKKSDII